MWKKTISRNRILKIHKCCFFLQKARFEKGKELLEAEFRSLLTRYSKPVPPILILDAISVDDELEVQEEVVLEHLPEAVLQDIICIAGWLVEYGRNQGTALLVVAVISHIPSIMVLWRYDALYKINLS